MSILIPSFLQGRKMNQFSPTMKHIVKAMCRGAEGTNGEKKGDICNTFSNKDKFKT